MLLCVELKLNVDELNKKGKTVINLFLGVLVWLEIGAYLSGIP